MAKWILLTTACAVAFLALTWLALAMQDHWQQVQGGEGPSTGTQAMLRLLGWSGIIVTGALCFTADRPSMAALNWIMLLTLGAVSVAMVLAWKPALLRFAWPSPSVSRSGR